MMNDLRTVKLTIISDLVCPWCFIGHRELERAMHQVAALPLHFEIEYRPYRLNQGISDSQPPVNRVTFMQNRYGKEKWEAMTTMAAQRGQQLGINFAWEGKFSQTTRAHRLLLKAWQVGGQDMQQRLVELLFQAHFEQNEDIGDVEMLSDRAERAGLMTREMALDWLDSDENEEEVAQMMEEARINGVTGVPFTVIDGKWAVSGGQSADVYVQIFQKLAACHIQELRTPKPMQIQPPAVTMAA